MQFMTLALASLAAIASALPSEPTSAMTLVERQSGCIGNYCPPGGSFIKAICYGGNEANCNATYAHNQCVAETGEPGGNNVAYPFCRQRYLDYCRCACKNNCDQDACRRFGLPGGYANGC